MEWVNALTKEANRALKEYESLCDKIREANYKIAKVSREIVMLENLIKFLKEPLNDRPDITD